MPATVTTHPRHPTRPERQIWRLQKVMEATGFGRAWIYALMAKGEFPKARRIGARAVGWDSLEVEQWIADRLGDQR